MKETRVPLTEYRELVEKAIKYDKIVAMKQYVEKCSTVEEKKDYVYNILTEMKLV